MSQIKGDDKWFQVCNIILGAAKAGLVKPVNRYLITTGQIAHDRRPAVRSSAIAVAMTRAPFGNSAVTSAGALPSALKTR